MPDSCKVVNEYFFGEGGSHLTACYARFMYAVLSDISALQFHRTPPVVHALFSRYPDISYELGRRTVAKRMRAGEHPFGSICSPIHVMVTNKSSGYALDSFVNHVWTRELVPGLVWDTEYGVSVTSPLATLLQVGMHVSTAQLTMLLSELMGGFAVYEPTDEVASWLRQQIACDSLPHVGGWRPASGNGDSLTNLWMRPPLIGAQELERFIDKMKGVPGVARLKRAARDACAGALSPFEVQVAMLLGMPRRRGGMGLGPFQINHRIHLTQQARRIVAQSKCDADLFIEGDEHHAPLVIECQGAGYHGNLQQSTHDDNRSMALQSMGYTVLRLRYEQIRDEEHLESTAACVARLLNTELAPKAERLMQAERNLMADVLVDWWRIGMPEGRSHA